MNGPAVNGRSSGERLPYLHAYSALVGREAEIEEILALGLYMRAECQWAIDPARSISAKDHKNYHQVASSGTRLDDTKSEASRMLDEYMNEIIHQDRVQLMAEALKTAQDAVDKKPISWIRDISVAVIAAALYTILLVLVAFILNWAGVDFDEIFKHISGKG